MNEREIFNTITDDLYTDLIKLDLKKHDIQSVNVVIYRKKEKRKKLIFKYKKEIIVAKLTINESLYVTEMLDEPFNLEAIVNEGKYFDKIEYEYVK